MTYDPADAKSIFLQACELPQSDRMSFLDCVCADKPDLRNRVDALLKSFDEAASFLAKPIADELDPTRDCRVSSSDQRADTGTGAPSDESDLDFLLPCQTPGRIGRLGGYEIIEVIGRGGMGIVLKACDTKLNRIVAIKVLLSQSTRNSMAVKRFLREAQAAAAVSHDHVITIFAVEEHAECPYLVMECIVGQSLQQKIERCSPLSLKEILRIGMQIASGLAAAHKQGLVHRDIKPLNILLENGVERVKITDFGLARAVDDVGMTQTGHIAGTPQYMSPEQAMGERVDARSDLFSFGSVLYSMCTGRPAFRAESAVAVLRRVCDGTPRPIREINPEIPEWLVTIIDTLMKKNPQERFQTAEEVADLLSQCLAWSQLPEGSRPVAIPSTEHFYPVNRFPRRLRLTAGFFALCLTAWALILPSFRLLATGRAQVEFCVNDGDTDIQVIGKDGEIVASQAGPGTIELPSGIYKIQVREKPQHELWNVFIQHWNLWMWKKETRISSPPGGLRIKAGDQVRIFISFAAHQPHSPMTQLGSDLGHAPTDLQLNPSLQTAANPSQATDTTRLQMLVAPFNAADAKRQQVEWSRHLEVPVEYTNSLGNRLQLLTPGRFNMGNSHDEVNYLLQQLQNQGSDAYTEFSIRSSAPRHYVQLEAPFYISQFETTVADFQLFVAEANYTSTLENLEPGQFNWRKYISQEEPSHQPVCGVSWDDAKAYCEWLSKRESVHYDLPTEAQWEYACRAGNDGRWCFGNDARRLETYAVYGQPNKPRPSPVGTKKPNDFGLYDLHGNVEEWCLDWHRSEFYANSPQANPVADGLATDPASGRVARGGSWYLADWRTRSATRMYDFPTIPTSAKGFRVVITGELKRVTNSVVK